MIRAAALAYAIVFSLLLGLMASAFIWIASAQKKVEIRSLNKETVLFDSYSAVQYGMYHLNENQASSTLIHPSGDTSELKSISWGAFTIIFTKTYKGNVKKERAALIGLEQNNSFPALYLSNSIEGLKVGGETRIRGKVFLPKGKVERAYIGGMIFTGDQLIEGRIETSESFLPPLYAKWRDLNWQQFYTEDKQKLSFENQDSVYSFLHPTTIYKSIEAIQIQESIEGNVIFHSFDSIFVSAKARLKNVILIAPIIHFEAGFTGNVQALASEKITCMEGVKLTYPSILALNEQKIKSPNSKRVIQLHENTEVFGGILLTTQAADFRKPISLQLFPKSTVAGMIYNQGESNLKGNVYGSIYTQKFITYAGGGIYSNHLINATISSKEMPVFFVYPNWLETEEQQKPKILQWL
jgi:hypothetical protein